MPHRKNPAEGHNPFGTVGNAQKSGPPKSNVKTKQPSAAATVSTNKRSRVAAAKRRAAKRKKRARGMKSGGR